MGIFFALFSWFCSCYFCSEVYILIHLKPPLRWRQIETSDQEFLDALYQDSRPDLLAMPLPQLAMQQMIRMQQMSQTQGIAHSYPNALHRLLLWHEDSVGRFVLAQDESSIRLIDIAIKSEWQGKGFATQVLVGLQEYASSHGKTIRLAVQSNNSRAYGIYQRLGFAVQSSDGLFNQMDWHPAW